MEIFLATGAWPPDGFFSAIAGHDFDFDFTTPEPYYWPRQPLPVLCAQSMRRRQGSTIALPLTIR